MAEDLVASFRLQLKDDLSSGIGRLKRLLADLRDITGSIGLSGLDGADALLANIARQAGILGDRLRRDTNEATLLARQMARIHDLSEAIGRRSSSGALRIAQAATAGALATSMAFSNPAPPMRMLGQSAYIDTTATEIPTAGFRAIGAAADEAAAGVGRLVAEIGHLRSPGAGDFAQTAASMRMLGHDDFIDTTATEIPTAGAGGGGRGRGRGRNGGGGWNVPPWPGFDFGPARDYGRNVVGAVRGLGGATEHAGSKVFGAAMAGFGLIEPIREAAEFDNTMRHLAITFGLNGKAADTMAADMGRMINKLALQTGQTSRELADAAGYLSREGYSAQDIRTVLPQIAQISTAYNSRPDAVAKTSFALMENMEIKPADVKKSLASLALVGKRADFSFEEMSQLFPNVAPAAAQLGVHGVEGVDRLGAQLAVLRKNSGTAGEAVTYQRDFIASMTSPSARKRFAKEGVDLVKLLANARKQGVDPIEAILAKIQQITHGDVHSAKFGDLFHNMYDKGFAIAMLAHLDQYKQILGELEHVNDKMIDTDYTEGAKSTLIHLQNFQETLTQLLRRVGIGFVPVMDLMTGGLKKLIAGIDYLDQKYPGLVNGILLVVGSMLALATVLGLLGAVAPMVVAGWRLMTVVLGPFSFAVRLARLALLPFGAALRVASIAMAPFGAALRVLLSPLGMLAPALGRVRTAVVALEVAMGSTIAGIVVLVVAFVAIFIAAAVDIYRHWDRFRGFFREMGQGIMTELSGLGQFIAGIFTGNMAKAVGGLQKAWSGLGAFYDGLWKTIKQLFTDFGAWIDSWSGGLATRILNGIKSGWSELTGGFAELMEKLKHPFGADQPQMVAGAAAPGAASPGAKSDPTTHQVGGTITVQATPGTKVTRTKSTNPQVQLSPGRGPMTSRN